MSRALQRILALWRPHRWLGLALAIALVLRTLFTVILALSIKVIIDRVVDGEIGGSAGGIVALLVAGYVVSAGAAVTSGYLTAQATARILADVRTAAFEHLQRLSIGYLGSRASAPIAVSDPRFACHAHAALELTPTNPATASRNCRRVRGRRFIEVAA